MNIDITSSKSDRQISRWLYLGVMMLIIQIVLGGITRLTESGLSITEWNPIMGALPPMNSADWLLEFAKYKGTAQFQYIHPDFTLSDFKNIFFWEWLHRNWARLMGLVFLAGFVYFLIKGRFKKYMIVPLIMLFFLGAIQGAIGWIMVKSGLVPKRLFVGHFELTAHFMAALVLLCYTFWFALYLSVPDAKKIRNTTLRTMVISVAVLLFFQLIYGAFMAGLHAATAASTWPSINGKFIPDEVAAPSNWVTDRLAVQFIHRSLAYLIFVLTFIWWIMALKVKDSIYFQKVKHLPMALVFLQLILGILTVLYSPIGNNLLYFGVAHQLTGILYLLSIVLLLFLINPGKQIIAPH